MLGLVSTSNAADPIETLKIALPFGIGLASAAFLVIKAANDRYGPDKSIPAVSLRSGDSTHDPEYNDDPDAFLDRCEQSHGPIFQILLLNKNLTVVSGSYIREVFMNDDFSAGDAIDEFTGMRAFLTSVTKSNREIDNRTAHEIVRDQITSRLPLFTPRIVGQLELNLKKQMALLQDGSSAEEVEKTSNRILVKKPLLVLQEMVASAMAHVFMGPEIGSDRNVIDSFIECTYDFGKVLGNGSRKKSFWKTFATRTKYGYLNPLERHIKILVDTATPVISERRRVEAETVAKGEEYKRPEDILQRLLDRFDEYGFLDLEDVMGHVLILVLASVHTTTDTSTNLLYYLGAFPEHMEKLYEEQNEVLDQQQRERELERLKITEERATNSEGTSSTDADSFTGHESLDPKDDRALTAQAIKKLVHLDSFVREVFRYRTERLTLTHTARKEVQLSNGTRIVKGTNVIINMKSAHQSAEQGEDVEEFRPWRFVGKPKAATKVGNDFLPFGMGRHACPGRFLAIQELKTVATLMVSKYSHIELEDPTKTKQILLSRVGQPIPTGLYLTPRV